MYVYIHIYTHTHTYIHISSIISQDDFDVNV